MIPILVCILFWVFVHNPMIKHMRANHGIRGSIWTERATLSVFSAGIVYAHCMGVNVMIPAIAIIILYMGNLILGNPWTVAKAMALKGEANEA